MLRSQRRRNCREEPGPTPHPVSVREKFPLPRPADQLVQQRQKQDSSRERALEFLWSQQTCGVKTSWLKTSEDRFLRGDLERRVQAALDQQDVLVQDRRDRLRALLAAEEVQLLQEVEEKVETPEERQIKMRERAQALRESRETERQQLVSDKLEQLFRQQCEELRTLQRRHTEQQVCSERSAQLRRGQEQLQQRQDEDQMFEELWEADRRAKEEREAQQEERRQQRNLQQLDSLRTQMEAAEEQRWQQRELQQEEARLMRQQQELWRLQQQRQQQQKLQDQLERRQQLDQGLRMKMRRLARQQRDELQRDMNILQLLQQDSNQKQEAAHRKAELHEEQQRYRQYLSEELQRQKREEEGTELLMEENLKEAWAKREDQSRLQQEASEQLMEEVMKTQSLQIQHKLDMNHQQQLELSKERDELNRMMEEMKLMDEEDIKHRRQTCEAYQADLRAQVEQQQQRLREQREEALKEHQQSLTQQDLYNQRREQILIRPHTITSHPFRAGGATGRIHPPPHMSNEHLEVKHVLP